MAEFVVSILNPVTISDFHYAIIVAKILHDNNVIVISTHTLQQKLPHSVVVAN